MPSRRVRASAAPVVSSEGQAQQPVARRDFLARAAAAVGAGLLAFAGRPALPGGDEARAATTGAEPYLGEIMMFAGTFPPQGWADCNGQLLPIAQNTALFSLLGTTYGGNGQTTFALPDLRGRAPIHVGQGPGLASYDLGERAGSETVTLLINEMPAHTHALRVDTSNGTTANPQNAFLARDPAGTPAYGAGSAGNLATAAVATVGASQPHENRPPYLTIRFCIALQGIFPPRN